MLEGQISYDISFVRPNELSTMSEVQPSNLTRYFKSRPETETKRTGSKITGIDPSGVEAFLTNRGFENIYRPGSYLFNSQCGGVSKTTSTITMAFAFARISDRKSFPVVILDLDSQASTTLQLLGWNKKREERLRKEEEVKEREKTGATKNPAKSEKTKATRMPVITDYIEGRVTSIKDLLIPIGDNVWLIPSSLENSYLEKIVGSPKKVKEVGESLLLDMFAELSVNGRLKIFIDAPPALSPVTHSFLYGMNALPDDCDKALCIPIRADDFGVNGCEIALEEFEDMLATYNTKQRLDIVPFFTFYDRRTTNSADAMDLALESKIITKYGLSKIVIRQSAELPKRLGKNSHIFSMGQKNHPVAQDYQDLMLSIMGWTKE